MKILDKFHSFCYDESNLVRDDINRGIYKFIDFVGLLYLTNFKIYLLITNSFPEGIDEFIEKMVYRYISIRMVEIEFRFDINSGNLVDSKTQGVLFNEYCIINTTFEKPIVIQNTNWVLDCFMSWIPNNDDSDDNIPENKISTK